MRCSGDLARARDYLALCRRLRSRGEMAAGAYAVRRSETLATVRDCRAVLAAILALQTPVRARPVWPSWMDAIAVEISRGEHERALARRVA